MRSIHVFASEPPLDAGTGVTVMGSRGRQILEYLTGIGLDVTTSLLTGPGLEHQVPALRSRRHDAAVWLSPAHMALPPYIFPNLLRVGDLASIRDREEADRVAEAFRGTGHAAGLTLDLSHGALMPIVLPTGAGAINLPADCPAPLRVHRVPQHRDVLILGDLSRLTHAQDAINGLVDRLLAIGATVRLAHMAISADQPPPPYLPGCGGEVTAILSLADLTTILASATLVVDPFPMLGEPVLATALRHAICARNHIPLMNWLGAGDTETIVTALATDAGRFVPVLHDHDWAAGLQAALAPAMRGVNGRRAGAGRSVTVVVGAAKGRDHIAHLLPLLSSLVDSGDLSGYSLIEEQADDGSPVLSHHGLGGMPSDADMVLVCGDPRWAMVEAVRLAVRSPLVYVDSLDFLKAPLARLIASGGLFCTPNPGICSALASRLGVGRSWTVPPTVQLPMQPSARHGAAAALVINARDGLALGAAKGPVLSAISRAVSHLKIPLLWFGQPDADFFAHVGNVRQQADADGLALMRLAMSGERVIPLGLAALDAMAGTDADMALFGACGHPGVYSASPAHVLGSLPAGLLVDNDEHAWFEAITTLAADGGVQGFDPVAIRLEREIGQLAQRAILPLLTALPVDAPVSLRELLSFHKMFKETAHEPQFDEEAYLELYPDVREAVLAGVVPDGYCHYVLFGRNEGRSGSFTNKPGSSLHDVIEHEMRTCRLQLVETQRLLDRLRRVSA